MRWTANQIRIDLSEDATEDPVVTLTIDTPAGRVWLMTEPTTIGGILHLRGVHLHGGAGIGPNRIGAGNLRQVVLLAMEVMHVRELVVEGAVRTTGSHPGHRPRPLRFTRALPP